MLVLIDKQKNKFEMMWSLLKDYKGGARTCRLRCQAREGCRYNGAAIFSVCGGQMTGMAFDVGPAL
jgi:hypothetical protein